MDQRQKEFIGSVANELAESIRATELADLLQLAKLVKMEHIDNIFDRVDSNFCRNLRLFDAVQESESSTAFDDFIKILERVDPDNAPRLKLTTSSIQGQNKEKKKDRSIIGRMIDRYARNPVARFPLGMRSSILSSASPSDYVSTTSYDSNNSAATLSSPLKEKHQATLVYHASGSSTKPTQENQLYQQSTVDNGYRLAPRYPEGHLPMTPPNASQSSHRGTIEGDRNNLRNFSKFSQTPTRPPELNLINNLSLLDEDGQEEPVVCWHPYAQSPNHEGASRASSPHRCLPSWSSASSESGESSSDSLILVPNLIIDPNEMAAMTRDPPNVMKVKTATICHNNSDEDYKMTARPRGKCLIVNNVNFENEIFPTRKGSDEDANRFDFIFKQLGFETVMTRNLTADAMKAKFRELAAACKPEHDALFVFILSHGSEHGIYGTDGFEVYLESEIISSFDNRNCRAMIGKPKVFVIQACRGRAKDCGGEGDTTDSIAWTPSTEDSPITGPSQENRVPASWLPSHQPSDGKRRKHPIRTDMLLVFSCLAG